MEAEDFRQLLAQVWTPGKPPLPTEGLRRGLENYLALQ